MSKKAIYQGKTALVTGASSGLGTDFVRQLASQGADIILAARREDRMKIIAKEVEEEFGVKTWVYTTDLSMEDAPKMLYDKIKKDGHQVDILINNAGFGVFGFFDETDWEKTVSMLNVDIRALTYLTHLFLEDMKTRNYGRILMVASNAAYQPNPTYSVYSGAKAYVLYFGEGIRYELKKRGYNIHVSVLSPGVTETEFLKVSGQKKTWYQRLFMMKSPKVVSIGLSGMRRNVPSRISGFMNWMLATSIRLVPRRWVPPMSYSLMKND